MNTTDIQDVLEVSVPDNFGVAVLPCDWLSRITADQFAVVVNSDTAASPGMHWMAIFKDKRKEEIEFFDSCSMPVNFYHPSIGEFLENKAKGVRLNCGRIQSEFSNTCGHFCIYYLLHRTLGKDFESILCDFSLSDLSSNDETVKRFLRDNFHINFSKGLGEGNTNSAAAIEDLVSVIQCCQVFEFLLN